VREEFLAEVLGVQRTTVTRVLTSFAETGMIAQRRGRILISDPRALAGGACECYAAVEQHFRRVAPRLQPGGQ
jgi:predicted transcriptional regulator